MTMPHLMNCLHSEDGWCLDCVKELWEEGTTIELSRQLSVSVNGHKELLGEVVSITPVSVECPVHEVMSINSDGTRHFAPGDVTTEFRVTCVSRRTRDARRSPE